MCEELLSLLKTYPEFLQKFNELYQILLALRDKNEASYGVPYAHSGDPLLSRKRRPSDDADDAGYQTKRYKVN